MNGDAIRVRVEVKLSQDKLEAYIALLPDQVGVVPTAEFLNNALERAGIKFGLNEAAVNDLAEYPQYGTPVLVAKGIAAEQGTDASLRFLFEKNVDITPKIKEDGSVDFKDLGLIQKVRKGDLLVLKKPREDGKPGTDVCGQVIPPPPGRDYPIPAGRNVELSPDRLKLFAGVDGQVIYHNDRVSVLDTYTVDGDVSTTTGNIDFNGNVVVKGNVKSGFRVRASGDVEVGGVVEAAVIEAGGDIVIRNGFNGGGTGSLTAEGCVMSKFIQSGTVLAGTKVETNYIYNSNVRSRNTVSVVGKGIVIGGHLCARTRIDAGTLGNESLTKTLVEVGADPEVLQRNQELNTEIENCTKNIKALEGAVKMLGQLKDAGKLPPEKMEHLNKSTVMLERLNYTLEEYMVEKEKIDKMLETFGRGYIGVRNIAYPGVTIKMGSEQMPLKGKYQHSLFMRDDGYIRSGPL